MKINMAPNLPPKEIISIDQTNKNPSGKILVELESLKHFPYQHNLFIRLQCNPFVFISRKILDANLDFQQRFYIPVHNPFNMLKVELINMMNDGWFKDHVKENLIASFEIRLPDIDKEPFDFNGYIKLPIPEITDFKKFGLKPQADYEKIVAMKKQYVNFTFLNDF